MHIEEEFPDETFFILTEKGALNTLYFHRKILSVKGRTSKIFEIDAGSGLFSKKNDNIHKKCSKNRKELNTFYTIHMKVYLSQF